MHSNVCRLLFLVALVVGACVGARNVAAPQTSRSAPVPAPPAITSPPLVTLRTPKGGSALAFRPDGRMLALGGGFENEDPRITLWEVPRLNSVVGLRAPHQVRAVGERERVSQLYGRLLI